MGSILSVEKEKHSFIYGKNYTTEEIILLNKNKKFINDYTLPQKILDRPTDCIF